MLRIDIVNDGTGATHEHPKRGDGVAEYDYTVSINGRIINTGRVRHGRFQGWRRLLAQVAQETCTKEGWAQESWD